MNKNNKIFQEIEDTPMPEEYKNLLANVHCKDCSSCNLSPFHVLGIFVVTLQPPPLPRTLYLHSVYQAFKLQSLYLSRTWYLHSVYQVFKLQYLSLPRTWYLHSFYCLVSTRSSSCNLSPFHVLSIYIDQFQSLPLPHTRYLLFKLQPLSLPCTWYLHIVYQLFKLQPFPQRVK